MGTMLKAVQVNKVHQRLSLYGEERERERERVGRGAGGRKSGAERGVSDRGGEG